MVNNDTTTSGAHSAASLTDRGGVSEVAANGSLDAPALDSAAGEVVFEIMVAVMWSDGELFAGEVERGRAAVDVMRVRPTRGGALGAIAHGPLPFPAIAFERLDRYTRRLAYAGACWLDDASEDPSERRRSFIGAVRTKLGLSQGEAAELRGIATTAGSVDGDALQAFAYLMRSV